MESLPTTSQMELIKKKQFAKMILNENFKTFMIYIAAMDTEMSIYL